ncbi:hypothetical protein M8997_008480 [Phyllobacterium sp. 21LDTY02-6]|uniref:hypothetical protein n=1 Tax=Phyllobacterium sp. 21LDTY02-6 TaxID=2944903 RepID=UPI0020218BC3|nr:hypothetical protein [Phyllobacterium sp. 21LDTY02-6]MCO4317214.1 hypothetical protein [Phyllobacterium sp. 21LDTY02-6]
MGTLFSVITVYGLYAMSSVPFIVWAGRSAYRGTVAHGESGLRAWPGVSSTIFRVVLPLALILLYAWNTIGGRSAPSIVSAGASGWTPYQFLLLPPAVGSLAGYVIGFFMGTRTKR